MDKKTEKTLQHIHEVTLKNKEEREAKPTHSIYRDPNEGLTTIFPSVDNEGTDGLSSVERQNKWAYDRYEDERNYAINRAKDLGTWDYEKNTFKKREVVHTPTVQELAAELKELRARLDNNNTPPPPAVTNDED